jgi:hypothetical protein
MLVAVTTAHAQMAPGQLTTVTKTSEMVLGTFKVVDGVVNGYPAVNVTVWVNGISTQADLQGHFRVLIPNEPVQTVVAFQRGTNATVISACGQGERVMRFNGANGDPQAIRDLLHQRAIRDLLHPYTDPNHPKPNAIRDLLPPNHAD